MRSGDQGEPTGYLSRSRSPRVERDTPHHQWLFPGTYPGPIAEAGRLGDLLNRELGLYTRPARASALCALAEDLPAPVLADLLAVHITTAIRWTSLVTHDWSSYLGARADGTACVLSQPPPTLQHG